jgi:two-component system response regulator GlrR
MRRRHVLIANLGLSPEADALSRILSEHPTQIACHTEPIPAIAYPHPSLDADLHAAVLSLPPALGILILPATLPRTQPIPSPPRLQAAPSIPWILVDTFLAPEDLLCALRSGFSDFLIPPFRGSEVLPRLLRHLDAPLPDLSIQNLKERIRLGHIVGQSPAFIAELQKIPPIARCDACVLIAGETGTGKEVFARAIHYLSPRAGKPFVAVNCGAIPSELVENELFGHEPGAYTGATAARAGLVEEAELGTLFLDEIDSLPLSAQVKLLRLLQEKEFRRLGSQRIRRADVRVVAAANSNLEDALRNYRFRSDLFYRLNVLPFRLPPLRERLEDIPLLAQHFATKYAIEFNRPVPRLAPAALARLQAHPWPGNVRELENVLERAVLLTDGLEVGPEQLMLDGSTAEQGARITFRQQKADVIRRFERDYLSALLARHRGNISHAAREAGKNRRALFELLRKHQLQARDFFIVRAHG